MNKEIFYHTGKKECDFIIQEGLQIKSAIQVAYELNDANIKGELEGLLEAMSIYNLNKGMLIVNDVIFPDLIPKKSYTKKCC